MRRRLLRWLEPAALWVLRETDYWGRINTIEGSDRYTKHTAVPGSAAEMNHRIFVAYEAGRHRLLWKLTHPD